MFLKSCFLGLLCSLLCPFSFAQTPSSRIDSLENLLKNYPQDDTTKVIILNNFTWELRFSTSYSDMLTRAEEAMRISKKLNYNRGLANALVNKGFIFVRRGDYIKATEYLLEAQKIFDAVKDQEGLALCFVQIAIVEARQTNYESSVEHSKKAHQIFVVLKNTFQQGRIYNNIGNVFVLWNKPDSALAYLKIAKVILEGSKSNLKYYVYYNMGVAYYQKKQPDLAESSFLTVISYFGQNEKKSDKYIYSKSFINLSDVYLEQQDHAQTLLCLQEGIRIAQAAGLKPEMQEGYMKLSKLYNLQARFDSAYFYQNLGIAIKDSLSIKESAEKMMYAQAKNEKEKESILLKLQTEETDNQRIVSIALSVVVGLVLLLALFGFRSQQRIKKAYITLENANDEIKNKNEELSTAFETIEEKSNKIEDSINYAKRIQTALLPFSERIEYHLGKENFFVLYKPRDTVSGDFYFFEQFGSQSVIIAADCTGHGVPGALMSMIGMSLLEDIVASKKTTEADKILNELHKKIRYALKQGETQNNDGMDIAVAVIDHNNKTLTYAGAKNPIIIIQNNELIEIKADKKAVGGEQIETERLFTKHQVDVSQATTFYIYSDGYQDQFGGAENKKFMTKQFKELLFAIHTKPLHEQKEILDQKITHWIGDKRQTDDILVIGVKI